MRYWILRFLTLTLAPALLWQGKRTRAQTVHQTFTTGRSQAVRLPKACRFEGTQVSVERQSDAVILLPKFQSKQERWAQMETILSGFEGLKLENWV